MTTPQTETEAPADTIRRAVGEFAKLKLSLTIAAAQEGHNGDPFVLVLDKITDWLTAEADAIPGTGYERSSIRHALAVARTYLGEDDPAPADHAPETLPGSAHREGEAG